MIVKTSKLYYPNPCDGLVMAVNVGSDVYSVDSFSTAITITLLAEATLTNLVLRVPSGKLASGIALTPSIYDVNDSSKTNLIPVPYTEASKTMNGVKFIVSNRLMIVDGKATEGTTAFFIVCASMTLPAGEYAFNWGTKIDYHNDVYFAGKFHNAMFMENEDCDGLIYQVKHRPNNFIFVNGGDGPQYVNYYNKLIYPQDKFVINPGVGSFSNPDGGWSRTKKYLIRGGGYTYGGNSAWMIASADGRHFLRGSIVGPAAQRNSSFSRTSDRGLIINDSRSAEYPVQGTIYIAEVSNTGLRFTKHPYQLPTGATILYGCNGIIYYKNANVFDNELHCIRCDGTHGDTGTEWGDGNANGTAVCWDDRGITIIYGYVIRSQAGVRTCDRWAAKFDKNGNHIKSYDYWDFPLYAPDSFVNQLYKFNGHYKLMCTRYDAFERRTVFDCYDYGPNFDPPGTVTYDAYNRTVKVPAVGWKTRDYRNSYYGGMDQNGYVSFSVSVYTTFNSSKQLYFKDGKLTEPYGYTIWGWQPYINRHCTAVIKGDMTSDPDEEPFLFETNTTDYLDPHNITWQRQW